MQQTKPLADKNGIVCYELLPYPIVHYPGFYGIFLGFRKNKKSSLALCSCSRAAIVNYLSIILSDRIERALENIIRQRFGHKQIGDAWTNETILYRIVLSLFPSFTVIRHYRPYFLRGLELDIYIPEIKLGVEYQGIQHYQSIEHWGGIESLEHLQERDARKKRLCSSNKVKLVYFEYTEGLSNKFVAEKLKGYLQQLFII